jgi:hypothetical protein
MYSRCYAIHEYITTIPEQRLGKHVPAEMNTQAITVLPWKQNVLYVVRAEMLGAGQFEVISSLNLAVA